MERARLTIVGRHVSSPSITTLQEEEIQVDHVEDNSGTGTFQKGLIGNRNYKNLDEWPSSKGQ
jgi:hypothetical protein